MTHRIILHGEIQRNGRYRFAMIFSFRNSLRISRPISKRFYLGTFLYVAMQNPRILFICVKIEYWHHKGYRRCLKREILFYTFQKHRLIPEVMVKNEWFKKYLGTEHNEWIWFLQRDYYKYSICILKKNGETVT